MSYTGNRKELVTAELLSSDDVSLGFIDGINGGNLSWNANATVSGGGSLILEDVKQDINFSLHRIRIWWEVVGEEPFPLGVYVIAAPTINYRADGSGRTLILIDKLTVIRDDVLLETFQLPAGTNAVEAAVQQVQLAGESRVVSTPSDYTLSNAMSWEPGTTRLQVINDLLTAANYWSLWTDRHGLFRIEPYIDPNSRPDVYEFIEGEASIHSPQWEYDLSLWEATNTVVLISQADDDEVTYSAYAVDDNPESPTSTVAMGRVLNAIVEENVEASSLDDLQRQATRKLRDNSNVAGKIQVSYAVVPVWYNEAVKFVSQGMDTKAIIIKMDLDLTPGALIRAEWRRA